MTMKKKFLSLALAAAIVVPSTLTAHAANQTVTGNDTETLQSNVTVTGAVSKADGTAPAGKIQVELPTKMAFTVDKVGNFNGANYTVNNQGAEAVDISVGEFRETNPNGGINLKGKNENLLSLSRDNVKLVLRGDGNKHVDLGATITSGNQDLLKVSGGQSGTIQLLGDAGKTTSESDSAKDGVTEEFNVVFKIKKSVN